MPTRRHCASVLALRIRQITLQRDIAVEEQTARDQLNAVGAAERSG